MASANSCALWTTLMEASNAYTRRKFADFKRLKRNLNVNRVSPGNSGNVYIFQPRSTSPPMTSSLLSLTPPPPAVTNSLTRTASSSNEPSSARAGSSNSFEPIKRSNANIDDATELNRLSANDDEAPEWRIKRHRPEISGSRLDATALDDLSATVTLDMNLDQAATIEPPRAPTSNGLQLMHDNNDSRTLASVGVNRLGNYLPQYNANESESLNIGVGIEQTKSHDPYEKPFNYANEVNYGSYYSHRIDADVKTKPRLSRSPALSASSSYPDERLIGGADDYSSFGTKELITQRRSHRINIGKSGRWRALQGTQYHQLGRRPAVIDKQQQDDKTPQSLNDEGSPKASKPLVWQTHSYDRNLANGAAGRFISDTEARTHVWPNYWRARLSKRHLTSEEDDQLLEMVKNRSKAKQNSQLLIDVHEMGVIDRIGEGATDELHVGGIKSGSLSPSSANQSNFSAASAINEQKLDSAPSYRRMDRVIHSAREPTQSGQNTLNRDFDIDDASDESLMWSASHYLHMNMKALASSSMFGIEVGVEWSNEKTNQTVPSNMGHKAELYRDDDTFSHMRPLSASPFATIDMFSGQDLQLECTAHTLGRLPEVKWYKKIASMPKWLKNISNIARRIGNDLYWPLTEIELLDEKPFGRANFVASQTLTVFDNLENQTFTVVNNLQLSQYNDKTQSQKIRSNTMPFSDFNLYACIVDADVRHNYATLGVNYRETMGQFAMEVSQRLRARAAMTKSNEGRQWSTNESPPGANAYNLFRTSQIHFPLSGHWIPIQNKSDMEDFSYETLPYAPVMLTVTIAVVSLSLLTLVYLTVRSYRSLVELQIEDNLTTHKMVTGVDARETTALSSREEFDCKYCSFHRDNQTECSCQFDAELINGHSFNFDDPDVISREDEIYELESFSTNQQAVEDQFYSNHEDVDNLVYQEPLASMITDIPSNQNFDRFHQLSESTLGADASSSRPENVISKDLSNKRQDVNMFENPMNADEFHSILKQD